MYRIAYTTTARKQPKKIQQQDALRITKTINIKLVDPFNASNVTTLTAHKYEYRLKVGNYRVFYNVDKVTIITSIEEVHHRQSKTY